MFNNKAIKILQKFDTVEFRRFIQFVHAGYATKDKYILRLVDVVEPFYPKLDDPALERQNVYASVYPKQQFDMPKLRRLFSDLTLLIEDFIIQEKMRDRNISKLPLLKKVYRDKGLENYYEHLLVTEQKELEEQPVRDAAYFQQLFQLHDEQYQFLSGKANRSIELQPQTLLNSLEFFYLGSKLRICCELVNRGNILNTGADQSMVIGLLAASDGDTYAKVPVIAVYRNILLTLTEPEETQHYQRLKELLKEVHPIFTPREMRDIYSLAQNYCIRKVNTGRQEYLKELFELYRSLLDSRLLMDDGHLSQFHYKNIVYVALRLNEFHWCLKFIKEMAAQLEPGVKENAYTYNLAYYYFFTKEYKQTMQLLNKIEFTDVFYFLDSRSLLLKTYFELDEMDPLLSLLDTFQANLKRNKLISSYQKTIYLNLMKVVKKMVRLQPRDKEQVEKLKKYVDGNKQIADRTWVLGKLQEYHA